MRFRSSFQKLTLAMLFLAANIGLALSPLLGSTVHATERETKVAEIINITQDGVDIPATANDLHFSGHAYLNEYGYYFKLNSLNDLRITFRISGLEPDTKYVVSSNLEDLSIYTGAELLNGITINYPIQPWGDKGTCIDEDSGRCITSYLNGVSITPNSEVPIDWSKGFNLSWEYNDAKILIYYDKSIVATSPYFSFAIQYANYPDYKISSYHQVSPLYHNADNPLQIVVQGTGYDESREYNISVQVSHADGNPATDPTDYTLGPITKLGSELNAGTTIVLEDYVMRVVDYKANFRNLDSYANNFIITVENQTLADAYDYSYDIYMNYTHIYGNGQVSGNNEGGIFGGNMSYIDIVIDEGKYNQYGLYSYLIPVTGQFPDDETFTYTLYYFNNDSDNYEYYSKFLDANPVILDTKTVTGREINAGAVGAKYEAPQGDEHPSYVAIVTDEQDRMFFFAISQLYFSSEPTLDSVYLQSENKDIYYSASRFSYVAVNEPGLYLPIHGSNFDPDTIYDVVIEDAIQQCEVTGIFIANCSTGNLPIINSTTLQISGQDLNDGKVTYELPLLSDKTQDIVRNIDIGIQLGETSWARSITRIYYTAPDSILNHTSKYQLDNALSTIKGISKNTSLDELQQNIAVANNGSVKLYKDGTELSTDDQVGTGMTIVVLDEFDRPFIEVTASVTGDVTGDGDITITDLVTVSRHVAGLTELSGAYKTAGDITGNEDIGITDVVKVSRDIAGLEEIK